MILEKCNTVITYLSQSTDANDNMIYFIMPPPGSLYPLPLFPLLPFSFVTLD